MAFDSVFPEDLRRELSGAAPPASVEDRVVRIASMAAEAECDEIRPTWQARFENALRNSLLVPCARTHHCAGKGRITVLPDCLVMGTIPDSAEGMFHHLGESAVALQQGVSIGLDFSTIRPAGSAGPDPRAFAPGPLGAMDCWTAMSHATMSLQLPDEAMLACLRIDHPDIEAFIQANRAEARLRKFEGAVLVPDAFMAALFADAHWPLVFDGRTHREVKAVALWAHLIKAVFQTPEIHVIFIDRVNQLNNLAHCETISAFSPRGVQALPPHGVALLGSINLAPLVSRSCFDRGDIEDEVLGDLTRTSVRFLDNMIDLSRYPLSDQETEAKAKRRIGLGAAGIDEALQLCGARHGSAEAAALTRRWLEIIRREAYRASALLAKERGVFPVYDESMLEAPCIEALDGETRGLIAEHGLRNGCLTSLPAIEIPVPSILDLAPKSQAGATATVEHPAHGPGEDISGDRGRGGTNAAPSGNAAPLHSGLHTPTPLEQLRLQAATERLIDGSVSVNVRCPADIGLGSFADLFVEAYQLGCKGLTASRPRPRAGAERGPTLKHASPDPNDQRPRDRSPQKTAGNEPRRAPAVSRCSSRQAAKRRDRRPGPIPLKTG